MSRRPAVGTRPIGVSTRLGLAVAAAEDPLEHARVLAEAGPQELAVVVLAEPVDVEDLRQLGAVAAADLRASARSSRPCCSRRTAASRTGRGAARRPSPAAAAVVSEPIVAPRNTPCSQSNASRTSGTTRRAAAAEQERVDRHARRGPPTRARSTGTAPAGVVKRAFGCAAGVVGRPGVQSLPCQSIRCAGGSSVMPSHQTSPSSVSAQLVKIVFARDRRHRVRVGLLARARARRRRSRPRG